MHSPRTMPRPQPRPVVQTNLPVNHPLYVLQDGFSEFVSRCEGADFEDANMAHQGKMSARDLQKMKQNPGLAYATKPASELAMDHRDSWQVRMPLSVAAEATLHQPGARIMLCQLSALQLLSAAVSVPQAGTSSSV